MNHDYELYIDNYNYIINEFNITINSFEKCYKQLKKIPKELWEEVHYKLENKYINNIELKRQLLKDTMYERELVLRNYNLHL